MIFYILATIFGALTCTGCLLYGLFVKETNECRLAACISFLAGLIIMISGIALCVFKG